MSDDAAQFKNTVKNTSIFSFFTSISRVLGLLRDMLRAHAFGTSMLAVAFDIAFRIPNMLRNLVAEGALAQAFIPLYDQYKDKNGGERDAAGVVIVFVLLVMLTATVVAFFLLPVIIPHLTNHPQFALHSALVEVAKINQITDVATLTTLQGQVLTTETTFTLAQILFPYIVFMSLSSLYMAMQYSHNIFWAGSMGPAILNMVILAIFGLFYFTFYDSHKSVAIYVWVGAVLSAALAQLIFQFIVVKRRGLSPRYSFKFKHSIIKGLFAMMLPALFGAAVQEIGQLVDIFLATSLKDEVPGAVPALNFSHRLIQLPMGVFGVAVATASLPQLSRLFNEKRHDDFRSNLVSAAKMNFFLMIPAIMGLIFLAKPITALLFEHGEFNKHSTEITAYALQFYALGILGYSLQKLFMSALYAQKNSKIPAVITAVILVLNISISISLMPYLQHGGLALGSALAAYLGVAAYLVVLKRRKMTAFATSDLIDLARIVGANALLGGLIFGLIYLLKQHQIDGSWLVAIVVPLAAVAYLVFCHFFRVKEVAHLLDLLGRITNKFRR